MIQIGDILPLKGCNGKAKIVSASKTFFWAKIDWPSYRYNGHEFPFSASGEYLGSVAWALPNLVMKEIEEFAL